MLDDQNKNTNANGKHIKIGENNMLYSQKFYYGDSVLFKEEAISGAEIDQAQLNYLRSKDNYQNVSTGQINALKSAK